MNESTCRIKLHGYKSIHLLYFPNCITYAENQVSHAHTSQLIEQTNEFIQIKVHPPSFLILCLTPKKRSVNIHTCKNVSLSTTM